MRYFFGFVLTFATLASAQVTVSVPKKIVPITAPVSTAGPLDLDVVVTTHDGKPVRGLQQQDFTVDLNKKPQPITGFLGTGATASTPVQTILMIDSVNTRITNVAYERQQIGRYLKQNGGKLDHPVTLAVLSDSGVHIISRASSDGNQLAASLNQASIGLRSISHDAGIWGWTDQLQFSVSGLENLAAAEQNRPGRKLLIWISPGWPLLSGPEVYLSSKDQQALFHTLVGLSASLRRARITLTSIDPLGTVDADSYRTVFYQQFTKGVRTARGMQIGYIGLQVLALQSGGQVFNSSNNVTGEIANAVADANAFYTIQIDSPPTERPNDFRAIAVHVDKRDVTARTRTSYYAQP